MLPNYNDMDLHSIQVFFGITSVDPQGMGIVCTPLYTSAGKFHISLYVESLHTRKHLPSPGLGRAFEVLHNLLRVLFIARVMDFTSTHSFSDLRGYHESVAGSKSQISGSVDLAQEERHTTM